VVKVKRISGSGCWGEEELGGASEQAGSCAVTREWAAFDGWPLASWAIIVAVAAAA